MSSEEGRQRASGPGFLGWGGRLHGCGLSSPQDPQASPPSSSRTVRSSPVFVSYEGSGCKHLLQSSGEPSWGKAWGPRVTGQHGARAAGAAPAAFPQRPRPGSFLEVTSSDVFPLAPRLSVPCFRGSSVHPGGGPHGQTLRFPDTVSRARLVSHPSNSVTDRRFEFQFFEGSCFRWRF